MTHANRRIVWLTLSVGSSTAITGPACNEIEPDQPTSALSETGASITPAHEAAFPADIVQRPSDFYDVKGRRWRWRGRANFGMPPSGASKEANDRPLSIVDGVRGPSPINIELTRDTLARDLRPLRLIGQDEYILEDLDFELADRILAMAVPPSTTPRTAGQAPQRLDASFGTYEWSSGLGPQKIIGSNDTWRIFYPGTTANWFYPHAWVPNNTPGVGGTGGSATLIGRSTAMSAAHVFYSSGSWIPNHGFGFGADRTASNAIVQPLGFPGATITIPGGWAAWQDHAYDYAVVEFSSHALSHPGDTTGWYGTSAYATKPSGANIYILGYPFAFPFLSPSMIAAASSSGTANHDNGTFRHWLDMEEGMSGACIFLDYHYCFGINIEESSSFNVGKKWDTVTYNFFHTYGVWP